MRVHKVKVPLDVFSGVLRFGATTAEVEYTLSSDAKLVVGKGSLTGDPEALRAAFRAGRAALRLVDGREAGVIIVAHTEGGATAFFELGR